MQLQLYDAGDVVGFDSRAVVRVFPAPNVADAEPDYFPLIELDPPDLPWRLTPEAPISGPSGGTLKPWLVLLALRRDEIAGEQPPGEHCPLPSISVAPAALPDLSQSWAWAHVSVSGKQAFAGDEIKSYLAQNPDRFVARLLCPRRLRPGTAYVACLVPAFKRGRLAGLGQSQAEAGARAAAERSRPARAGRVGARRGPAARLDAAAPSRRRSDGAGGRPG